MVWHYHQWWCGRLCLSSCRWSMWKEEFHLVDTSCTKVFLERPSSSWILWSLFTALFDLCTNPMILGAINITLITPWHSFRPAVTAICKVWDIHIMCTTAIGATMLVALSVTKYSTEIYAPTLSCHCFTAAWRWGRMLAAVWSPLRTSILRSAVTCLSSSIHRGLCLLSIQWPLRERYAFVENLLIQISDVQCTNFTSIFERASFTFVFASW